MALEHTLEDVYAASAVTVERPTGVRRRDPGPAVGRTEAKPVARRRAASSEQLTHGPSTWPFRAQAYIAALEHVSDAVLIVDRCGTVRYANGAGRALVERPRPEGLQVLELFGVSEKSHQARGVLRSVLNELRDTTLWHGTASVEILGKPRELELSVRAVTVSGWGRAHGFSLVARPACVGALPAELRSSAGDVFASMMRLAGTVAHDFNNQIAVILNYSFILLRELGRELPARAHVEELQQAAWRAAETARHLLRLSDKRSPEQSALDANEVIREAHAALSLISRSHTEVELRLSHEPCMAKARQPELEWLLLDLARRLRARLGELARLRIATSPAALGCKPRVRIDLEAFPVATQSLRSLPCEHEPSEHLPRLSAQLDYELALQPLPDSGLRYAIELLGV